MMGVMFDGMQTVVFQDIASEYVPAIYELLAVMIHDAIL